MFVTELRAWPTCLHFHVPCIPAQGLQEGEARLSLLTNFKGGIIDDTVVTNAGETVYMVVNGATKEGDIRHFKEQLALFDGDVILEPCEDLALLALQVFRQSEHVACDVHFLSLLQFADGRHVVYFLECVVAR